MSGFYNKYRAKGVEVLMAALNDNPQVPDFIRRYNVAFPVGVADPASDPRSFMQIPVMVRASVPWKVIIDRKGIIRAQFTGEEPHFKNEEADTTQWVDKLLAEATVGGGSAAGTRRKR